MNHAAAAVEPGYFDRLYAADPDPWRFRTSAYERAKYAVTLAALPQQRFASGLEIGCSIGVLTRQLAPLCNRLLGLDVAAAPLVQARRACFGQPQVSFRQAQVPHDWPAGRFDLVMLSEVLYFIGPGNIPVLARCLQRSLLPGGAVVLVNWLGDTGTAVGGDAAAELMIEATDGLLLRRLHMRMPRYRLDVLTRRDVAGKVSTLRP
jgi:trans-aconitate methyltransferase